MAGGVAATVVAVAVVSSSGGGRSIALDPISDQTLDKPHTLRLVVPVRHTGSAPEGLRFSLENSPKGARIDATTGEFAWRPAEEQRSGTYPVTVRAVAKGGLSAQRTFRVTVHEAPRPPEIEPIGEKTVRAGATLSFLVQAQDPATPGGTLRFSLGADSPAGARIDPSSGQFEWAPQGVKPGELIQFLVIVQADRPKSPAAQRSFQVRVEDAEKPPPADSEPVKVANRRSRRDSQPVMQAAEKKTSEPAMKTPETKPAETKAQGEKTDPGDEVVLELYRKNKILSKPEYPKLRKVYADRFAAEHRKEIEAAFGDSSSEFRHWLDDHRDIQEELYLAIDPRYDNIPRVLTLFKELKDRFPRHIEAYVNLAIAVAVVWDNPRGVHNGPLGQHQSVAPPKQLEAMENFQYYVQAEAAMQGRAQLLPWEFLVLLVNHRSTFAERQWALANYLPRRTMFGKCYSDVPYDGPMLEGHDPKLKGREHTLPNQKYYGGVCSCQADFAARVGKSIGVPAFSASAANRYGGLHAWVMWVELGPVTRTGFTFSLQSHGRYRGDNYYVGHLADPHTAQRVSDRQMELRLHTVGMDPIANRQADLVMRSYPMLRETEEMDVPHQILFLGRVIEFCPGNEAAWRTLAKMSREGQITKTNSKPMVRILDRLFNTFRSLPDFTWELFDDMMAFEDRTKQRALSFSRLAGLYEQAGRADLSCEARLKLAEYLAADKRSRDAVETLAASILVFPDEGRYVPRMLDKLEQVCPKDPRSQQQLIQFYQQFLPKIPQKRGDSPSEYCVQMYKRGIQRFQEAGLTQVVQLYQAQLAKLEAADVKKR